MINLFEKPITIKALREGMKSITYHFRFNVTIIKFPTLPQRLLANKAVESVEKLLVVKFEYKKGNEVFYHCLFVFPDLCNSVPPKMLKQDFTHDKSFAVLLLVKTH